MTRPLGDRLLLLCIALALAGGWGAVPAVGQGTAPDLRQSQQAWMTAPAQDPALFEELAQLGAAASILARLDGLPEDQQFAYAIAVLGYLPPSEQPALVAAMRERVEASDNAAAKTRMSLLAAEQMSTSVEEALGHFDAAVRTAAAADDLEGMSYALNSKAFLLSSTGDAQRAATAFGMVAELCKRRDRPDLRVAALLMQANQLIKAGEPARAAPVLRDAKAEARLTERDDLMGSVRLTEGMTAAAQKNYDQALDHLAAARGLFEKLPPPGEPQGLLGVHQQTASVYQARNQQGPAMKSWERVMYSATRLGQVEMVAQALRGMANARLAMGNVEPAMTLADLAINQLEKVQPPGRVHLQELTLNYELMAACFRHQGHPELALSMLGRAQEHAEALGSAERIAALAAEIATINAELNPESVEESAEEPAEQP